MESYDLLICVAYFWFFEYFLKDGPFLYILDQNNEISIENGKIFENTPEKKIIPYLILVSMHLHHGDAASG